MIQLFLSSEKSNNIQNSGTLDTYKVSIKHGIGKRMTVFIINEATELFL